MLRKRDPIEELSEAYYKEIMNEYFEYEDYKKIWREFAEFGDKRITIPLSVSQVVHACKALGFDKEILSGIHLILLTSIIEILTRRIEYQDFSEWYSENRDEYEEKKCLKAYSDYKNVHGITKNYRGFFENLPEEEQIRLIPTVEIFHEKRTLAPFCYQNKDVCFEPDEFRCIYVTGRKDCPLIKDKTVRRKGIRGFANFLYTLRSNFVHSARIPVFSSSLPGAAGRMDVYTHIESRGYSGGCIITLDIKYLHGLVMRYLPDLFHEYLTEVRKE